MDAMRTVDAYCSSCEEVRPHVVRVDDPGSCKCSSCGTTQLMMHPLAEPVAA